MNTKKTLLICLGILLLAAVVVFLIFWTEPSAKSESAVKKTAILVEIENVSKGNYSPVFVATGDVMPLQDVMLSPQVSGEIIHRSPSFIPGGNVEKGKLLLQIDPSDYQSQLKLRKSELLQTRTDLSIEMGRQKVAEQDLALAGIDSLSPGERNLVLRKPQLEAIKANIQAAQANVEQAKLNLARTSMEAPFDAHVIEQNVTEGSLVSPGDDLGRLVGTEFYWVEIALPTEKLKWLSFPVSESDKGSMVKISGANWPKGDFRMGYLDTQIGALNEQTRLARILVKIPDPLGLKGSKTDERKLIIGSFVEAKIQADEVKNLIRLNRDYLRQNQTVWVFKDGKLDIRKVDVLLYDSKYAYIRNGLKDNEKVVTTNLSTVTDGIGLRIKEIDNIPKKVESKDSIPGQ